jgi:hypothetical protein
MTQRHVLLTPDEVTSNPVVDLMPPPAGDDVASNPSTEDTFIDDEEDPYDACAYCLGVCPSVDSSRD